MGAAWSLTCASVALALLVLVAGGGGASAPAQQLGSVTVYSSLPLQGVQRGAHAVERGIRLAIEEAGGSTGTFDVRYESLDDSSHRAGAWTPGRESRNARRAALDDSAVAYIGALNSGATEVSLPILNEAGVFQVSPTNTFTGLTRDEPGAEPGEPDKYYPTGERTYVRVIPRNTIQGAALALVMHESGCERAYLVHSGRAYGRGLAKNTRRFARQRDIDVVGFAEMQPRAPNYRNLAAAARDRRADCMFFGGLTADNALQLFHDVSQAAPRAKLFGADGVAERAFTDPRVGGLRPRVARKTWLTHPTLAHDAYSPAAQDFFTRYRARYGKDAGRYGIYGYEAMSLVLDAIARAGVQGNERAAVVEAGFATSDRESVLGTYSIDRFGDTSLTDYGVYRIADGRLLWDRVVRP